MCNKLLSRDSIMAALRRIGVPFLRGFLRPGTSTALRRPSLDSGVAVVQCRRSSDEPYAQESPPVPGRWLRVWDWESM